MALFRRLLLVALLALSGGALFVSLPLPVSAGQCACGCRIGGRTGTPVAGGATCSSNNTCTIRQCQDDCRAVGAVPTGAMTGVLYACADAQVDTPAPAPTPTPTPAPAPSGGTGGTGSGAPAAPRRGICRFSCGASAGAEGQRATQEVSCRNAADCSSACTNRCSVGPGSDGSGLAAGLTCSDSPSPECIFPSAETPAAPSSGGSSSLRFSLPSCTETGNCTLTDIVNTGVRFANFLIAFSGVIFLMTFLYAGAWLLFFAYDSSAIKKAQGMITGAAIGIIIVMTAGVAVRFVSSALGVNSETTRLPGVTSRTGRTTP